MPESCLLIFLTGQVSRRSTPFRFSRYRSRDMGPTGGQCCRQSNNELDLIKAMKFCLFLSSFLYHKFWPAKRGLFLENG